MGRDDKGENKSHLFNEIKTLFFITWGFFYNLLPVFFYIGRKAYC